MVKMSVRESAGQEEASGPEIVNEAVVNQGTLIFCGWSGTQRGRSRPQRIDRVYQLAVAYVRGEEKKEKKTKKEVPKQK